MQNGLLEFTPSPVQPVFKSPANKRDQRTHKLTWFQIGEARRRTSSLSYRWGKRLLDLVICIGLAILLSPLLLVLAVAVRLSSPGNVLYREIRIGRFGKQFTIYKFRSMYTREYLTKVLGYDECEIAQLRRRQHGKTDGDPRVTPIGRFLRVSSLDELPQLLNVIKGDMSLVGPRPVVAAELLCYEEHQPMYKLVRPGISGLWQISGRSNLSFQERVQIDARYCRKWTFWGDVAILWKTLPVVAKRHGAY